jgi:hypothetical protein
VSRRLAAALLILCLHAPTAAAQPPACTGDCGDDGQVTIDDLVRSVNLALGQPAGSPCVAADGNGNGSVTIDELVGAVNNALNGCPLRPTVAASPSDTPTSNPTATETPTITPPPVSTPTITPTGSITSTATATATATAPITPQVGGGIIDVKVFQAHDGTLYYVVGVDADPNGVGIGAQVTSLAFSDRNALSVNEPFFGSDPIITSVSGAASGRLVPLSRIRRTEVLTGFKSNDVVLQNPPQFDDGDFEPSGSGRLTLPDGMRTVAFDGSGTETLSSVTTPTGSGDTHVPAAVLKRRIRRQRAPVVFEADTMVFPEPGDSQCVESSSDGQPCTSDDDCIEMGSCSQVGQGCCGRASSPPTCSRNPLVVCDPNGSVDICLLDGICNMPGGETPDQTITFDDEVNSRVGNPASQPDAADGFFLHDRTDLIVFVVEPDPELPAVSAATSGFLLAGSCTGSGGDPGCASDSDCVRGGRGPCRQDFDSRIVIEAVSGEATAERVRRQPQPESARGVLLDQQVFVSDDNTVYYVLKVDPVAGAIGAQITSLMLTSGTAANVNESLNEPPDAVLTSFSGSLSGQILCDPSLASIVRTALLTGLTSNDIENASPPVPVNGAFDPAANNGTGLLILPGGLRTVVYDGTGTESVQPITTSGGAGATFVPAAVETHVTRRLGGEALQNVPVIVFPNPAGPVTTSSGATCVGGINPGTACDPATNGTRTDPCGGGGSCTNLGGASPGQNVTLDSVVDRRVGNPASQGDAVDGFFIGNTTEMIVFMTKLCAPSGSAGASGFAVTGTCSNNAVAACANDEECPGGTCTDELSARQVIASTRTPAQTSAIAGVQVFVSETNQFYFVLSSNPSPGSVGAQVTSLALSANPVVNADEIPSTSADPVITAMSAGRSAIDAARSRRTQIITGLTSNFIENQGNPFNGVFDPAGDGVLTLPGGALTVAGNQGTVPIGPITSASGSGITLVPAIEPTSVTRQLGLRVLDELTSFVFPNPPGPIVTSAGATCQGGGHDGAPCDPANNGTIVDGCAPLGACVNLGGETTGQNVTLDDTIGSRVGNPAAQGNAIDGFFLPDTTAMIVFIVDGGADLDDVFVSASGFRVTGTCTNAEVPCQVDADCPGGTCGYSLAQRNVVPPAEGSSTFFLANPPTPAPTPSSAVE